MTHIPTIEYDARHAAHVELIIAENERAQSGKLSGDEIITDIRITAQK